MSYSSAHDEATWSREQGLTNRTTTPACVLACRRTMPFTSAWWPSGPARTSAGRHWRQRTGRTSCTAPTAHSSRARAHPRARQCQHHPEVQLRLHQSSSSSGCSCGCLRLQSLCWRRSGSIRGSSSSNIGCCSSYTARYRVTAALIVSAQSEAVVGTQHVLKASWFGVTQESACATADAGGVCGLLSSLWTCGPR
jgi:hypothetical protein